MGNTNNPYADQYGFRVIELKASSPAEKAGLTVSSDFIISINGKYLNDLETSEITRLVAVSDVFFDCLFVSDCFLLFSL
jgi:C-terminal processing protease CtpA/Prc